jgi:hypothetical protein
VNMTRHEAHLLLAAIRVQSHLKERSPTPAEVAELLDLSESAVRLQLVFLQDLGAVDLVDSAFATHAEIGDHLQVETLGESAGPALSEDLKAFDRRKQEESERMAHLFDSGESEQERQDKLGRMDEELKEFRRQKPANPFGDD